MTRAFTVAFTSFSPRRRGGSTWLRRRRGGAADYDGPSFRRRLRGGDWEQGAAASLVVLVQLGW
jgi:hypothetical protein